MPKKIFTRVGSSKRSWLRILLKIWKVSQWPALPGKPYLCLHLHGDLPAYRSWAELKLKVRHEQLIHIGTHQAAVIWDTYKQTAWGHHFYLQNCAALKVIKVSEAKCLSQGKKGQQKFHLTASEATGVKYSSFPLFFFFSPTYAYYRLWWIYTFNGMGKCICVHTRDHTLKRAVIIRQHSYVVYIG